MSTDAPWTIGRLLEWTTRFLQGKGVESARLEADLLLAHVLGCQRILLRTRYDEVQPDDVRARFRELVQQRVKGTPVARLLGQKEFFLLTFEVGPDVLVPRPDTELLVTECLSLAKPTAAPAVLDVGTGTGCVALSVAHQHKGAVVTATDVSPTALAVARRNAERHGLAGRVRLLEGDLFAPVAGEAFDFILCNPPYIATAAIAGLAAEVRDHDPRLALDGGPDGFAAIDRLIADAPAHLRPGGYLMIEIGFDQEADGRRRFEEHGGYLLGKTVRDLGGRPRVLQARKKA